MKNFGYAPLLLLFFSLFIGSCKKPKVTSFTNSQMELYRPAYHFSPAKGWMNDPNGLVYIEGEYHLFFQHYPDSTVWGPMHWGHAVSENLIDWQELPIALFPDSLGYIFSGSIVYDEANSSGLGSLDAPPLIALFTYHDPKGEKEGSLIFQNQGLAYSLDKGKNWIKYAENPVLTNPGIRDFRDPKITPIKHKDGKSSWVMSLAARDRVHFYESNNLINWNFLGEFGQGEGAHGGVWECPDLLTLTAPDGSQKWVLLVSMNPGGPQKGSATQYFIGDFNKGVFTPDDSLIRWLDYGPDNYAGVTWVNVPKEQNRVLWIGWMSNWDYAQVVPTFTWRSAMTIPREISLFEVSGKLLLKSTPIKEINSLLREPFYASENESLLPSASVKISAVLGEEDNFSLVLSNELGEEVRITKEMGLVTIDRRKASQKIFHPDFAAAHSAPMSWIAKNFEIYLDASSIELFINDGELVMTSLLFPTSPWKKIEQLNGIELVKIVDLQ